MKYLPIFFLDFFESKTPIISHLMHRQAEHSIKIFCKWQMKLKNFSSPSHSPQKTDIEPIDIQKFRSVRQQMALHAKYFCNSLDGRRLVGRPADRHTHNFNCLHQMLFLTKTILLQGSVDFVLLRGQSDSLGGWARQCLAWSSWIVVPGH